MSDTKYNSADGIPVAALANDTDGVLITYDASGVATTVGPGTSGQVYTSGGAGAPGSFEDAAAGLGLSGSTYTSAVSLVDSGDWIIQGGNFNNTEIMYALYESSSISWQARTPIAAPNGVAATSATFDSVKDITFEVRLRAIGNVGDSNWGFGDGFTSTYNTTAFRRISFASDGVTLFAISCDGTTTTETNIASGITINEWHTYKIVYNPGVNAVYSVDGTTKATHTTNLPTGVGAVSWGLGGSTSGDDAAFQGLSITQEL